MALLGTILLYTESGAEMRYLMEMKEKKIVDELTENSVSVATDRYILEDGEELKVGERNRCSYVNSNFGRNRLQESEPDDIVNAVFARWGQTATVPEPLEQ